VKQEKVAIFSLFILFLLFISSFVNIQGINTPGVGFSPFVKANGIAMEYGYVQNTTNPPYDEDEYNDEWSVCDTINNNYWLFDANWVYSFDVYCNLTTAYWVAYALDEQSTGEYADYVVNWWVGDFHPSSVFYPEPYGHMWCFGYDFQDISDNEVFTHATNYGTQSSYESFTFMWTCSNGGCYWNDQQSWDEVPGITLPLIPEAEPTPTFTPVNTNNHYGYLFGIYGEVGMPFAWTGRTDLSLDGYGDSDYTNYCYIGFQGPSPGMKCELPGLSGICGKDFALAFFYESATSRSNVHDALDVASDACYGTNFGGTPLYDGWWHKANGYWWYTTMRVYGDTLDCIAG
jgi:hypothetical protein